jgi:hypothetical protein
MQDTQPTYTQCHAFANACISNSCTQTTPPCLHTPTHAQALEDQPLPYNMVDTQLQKCPCKSRLVLHAGTSCNMHVIVSFTLFASVSKAPVCRWRLWATPNSATPRDCLIHRGSPGCETREAYVCPCIYNIYIYIYIYIQGSFNHKLD